MNSKSILLTLNSPEDAKSFLRIVQEAIALVAAIPQRFLSPKAKAKSRPASGCTTGILLDSIAQAESALPVADSFLQCITTKFIAPTNRRGSRISAKCAAGKLTIAFDYGMRTEDAHRGAAEALRDKLGWKGQLQGGGLPDGKGYAFVFTTFE